MQTLVERPGRWALPPQPPETWVGKNTTVVLVIGLALAFGVPGLALLPNGGAASVLLALSYAAGGLLSVAVAYLLRVQATVTQDRRLDWCAGAFVLLLGLSLARAALPAVPGRVGPDDDVHAAAALSLVWLLVLPVVSLSSHLAGRRNLLHPLIPLVLLGAALAGAWQLDLVSTVDGAVQPLDRSLLLGAATLSLLAALDWRAQAPFGNRGPWGWVGAVLLLGPVVALLRAGSPGEGDPLAWAGLGVELLALALCAVGLYHVSASGYLRQARRWRQLETEVRQLRASSALLPGLSITPEDEGGLPEPDDVRALLKAAAVQIALQPVLRLDTLEPVGQEALARFGGRVPTDRWFRAAGLHGLGPELEVQTLTAALASLERLGEGQFLALNCSPASLHEPSVLALLESTDLSRIVVEITEHDAVNDYALTRQALGVLRGNGARIAVDDVGAGFASLRHVLLLQPDVVKLDTSLTRDVHESPRQQAIVRAVVTFADEVGAVVLAEGIEVQEQIAPLADAGVTLGQGWHLGIPVIG